jgi:hypothetical protein
MHLNITLRSQAGYSKRSLPLRFPHQNPVCTSPLPYTCYMPCPSHSLDFFIRITFGEEYRSLRSSLYSFFPLPCYLVPLTPKYSPQHPINKHPQPMFLPQCERPVFTPIQNNLQNDIFVYLNLYIFWKANWKTKYSSPNDSKHSLTSICS